MTAASNGRSLDKSSQRRLANVGLPFSSTIQPPGQFQPGIEHPFPGPSFWLRLVRADRRGEVMDPARWPATVHLRREQRLPGLSRRDIGRDRPLWQESLEGRSHRRGDPRPGWNLPVRSYPDPDRQGRPLKKVLLAAIALLLAVIACGPAAAPTLPAWPNVVVRFKHTFIFLSPPK